MIGDALSYLFDSANWQGSDGMLTQLFQQLLVTVTALALAAAVGLPIALWLGHLGRAGFLVVNISNIGRAIPTYAVLVVLSVGPLNQTGEFGPFGRSGLATLVALVLFALPPIITNAYVGISEVDRDIVEASKGMGMQGRQMFWGVELPLATPVVVTGLRLALVQVWATATIAALVAGPGLGNVIVGGFFNGDYGKGMAGAIVVSLVALILELGSALLQRWLDPLRRSRSSTGGYGRLRTRHKTEPVETDLVT